MRNDPQSTQLAFRALADQTRRDILLQLSQQEMSIGDLVDQFDITRAAVKKHLIILEQGGLISVQARGRERINSIEPDSLEIVFNWLAHFDHFWDEKLQGLKKVVEDAGSKNKTPP